MCQGNRNHRCQAFWYGLKACLIKPLQTSRTIASPFSPNEILWHATGEEESGRYNALHALLSLWKEATQVLLTQGLLPEIAFWPTWLSGIWNELLMDTRLFYALVAHSLLSSFRAFILSLLLFFFFSYSPQKLLLMRFIPGALTLAAASPKENRTEAGGGAEDCTQTTGMETGNSFQFCLKLGILKKGTFLYQCGIFLKWLCPIDFFFTHLKWTSRVFYFLLIVITWKNVL